MTKMFFKSSLTGGIILFIWNAISWMVLPWHMMTIQHFQNEPAVSQAIQHNATTSGIYLLPLQYSVNNANSPMIFASVHLQGMGSMNSALIIQFIIQIAGAFLVTWLLSKTKNLSYWGRVKFIFVFALAAAIITELPYWNWFAFSTGYTLVGIADILLGWFLAGLAMAKIVKN